MGYLRAAEKTSLDTHLDCLMPDVLILNGLNHPRTVRSLLGRLLLNLAHDRNVSLQRVLHGVNDVGVEVHGIAVHGALIRAGDN